MYEITSDIPYNSNGIIDDMPFKDLEPGESFFIPADNETSINSLMNLVGRARKIYPDKYFASKRRSEGDYEGIRVWSLNPENRPAPRKAPTKKK